MESFQQRGSMQMVTEATVEYDQLGLNMTRPVRQIYTSQGQRARRFRNLSNMVETEAPSPVNMMQRRIITQGSQLESFSNGNSSVMSLNLLNLVRQQQNMILPPKDNI